MGILADIYSGGNTLKRRMNALMADPAGTIDQGVRNFGEDQNKLLNLFANAYPMPGNKTVLNSPQQIAQFRSQAADEAGNMGLSGMTSRADKMANMGMERGWFRGGPKPNSAGNRTGPWYTKDAEEASGYAKRLGENADVREYAIPAKGFFNAGMGYNSKLADDVAKIVESPQFGKDGAYLAKELRTYGHEEQVPGSAIWQALESRFGNDGAAEVIQKLGFKGAKGITGGPEAYVFKTAPVRDANKAQFNLANAAQDNIYGKASLPFLGLLGGSAIGLNHLLRKD